MYAGILVELRDTRSQGYRTQVIDLLPASLIAVSC